MTENGRFAEICIYNSAMRVVEETIIEIQKLVPAVEVQLQQYK